MADYTVSALSRLDQSAVQAGCRVFCGENVLRGQSVNWYTLDSAEVSRSYANAAVDDNANLIWQNPATLATSSFGSTLTRAIRNADTDHNIGALVFELPAGAVFDCVWAVLPRSDPSFGWTISVFLASDSAFSTDRIELVSSVALNSLGAQSFLWTNLGAGYKQYTVTATSYLQFVLKAEGSTIAARGVDPAVISVGAGRQTILGVPLDYPQTQHKWHRVAATQKTETGIEYDYVFSEFQREVEQELLLTEQDLYNIDSKARFLQLFRDFSQNGTLPIWQIWQNCTVAGAPSAEACWGRLLDIEDFTVAQGVRDYRAKLKWREQGPPFDKYNAFPA